MIQANTVLPSIDYAAHPAFRAFAPAPASDDTAIDESIRKIDSALEQIHGSPSFLAEAEIHQQYQTRIVPELDAIGRLVEKSIPQDLTIAGIARASLAETREE